MTESATPREGPDLTLGVSAADLAEGAMLVGHVGEDAVLLARVDGAVLAVSAACTHYHGPLGEGLLVGDSVRCPWHHARFSLKTGEAIGAPAMEPLGCWRVEQAEGRLVVHERATATVGPSRVRRPAAPRRVVVIGGGGAGFAAAELLRREGFDGDVTVLSDDSDPPYDRPNCSKDYLAGKAPRDWMPLKSAAYYSENGIDLRLGVRVAALDLAARSVTLADAAAVGFDALILATGAAPIRPAIPGFDGPGVHVLRSLADCEILIAAAAGARSAAVVGAGFIGLEVAAALTERGLAVTVVAPQTTPLAKVLGDELGGFVRSLHEARGVIFHLGRSVTGYRDGLLTLDDGAAVQADFVVVGVGVRPRVDLAEGAGLANDRGVVVDRRLQTAAPGVFAAGDVARYPDPRSGALVRVEHWVAAQRQGQHVARVLLGQADAFTDPPVFWSAHYDATIRYVGHAEGHDVAEVEGDVAAGDATVRFLRDGRLVAAATVGRDLESLKAELSLEV